jgi:hypothetical protein
MKDKTFPLAFAPAIAVPLGEMIFGDQPHLMGIGTAAEKLSTGQLDFAGFVKEATNSISYETIGYTPYQNSWNFGIIGRNLALIAAGVAVHKLSTKFGINRQFKKIPLIGKYVSL